MPEQVPDIDATAAEMAEAQRDRLDAMAGALFALCAGTGIPLRMLPNGNGRTYPRALLERATREYAGKINQGFLIELQHRFRRDEWPGQFTDPESVGAVQWCQNWVRPVAAVDWTAPEIKPPSQWREETRQHFGVVGNIVPNVVLQRHEQTTLYQTRGGSAYHSRSRADPNPGYICCPYIPAGLAAEQARAALRHGGSAQSGQDPARPGDQPPPPE